MDALGRDAAWTVAGVALGAAAVQSARLWWRAAWPRWRLARRRAVARRAEAAAAALLEARGFAVLAAQAETRWAVTIGGEASEVTLRADYLVERRGRRYVAEVKSGRSAPSLTDRATRRQLLEYACAFAVDGVLLVDPAADRVDEVRFPLPRRPSAWRWLAFFLGAALGALAALAAR